jgi:hypothetical protein
VPMNSSFENDNTNKESDANIVNLEEEKAAPEPDVTNENNAPQNEPPSEED